MQIIDLFHYAYIPFMAKSTEIPQKVVISPFFKIHLWKLKVIKFKEIPIKITEQVVHVFGKNSVGGMKRF